MDRVTARGLIAAKVEDPSQARFTAAQYNSAIDLAQQQFAMDGKSIVKETTLTATAGTGTGVTNISLPTDFLACVLVRHKGLKLAPTTRWEMSFQSGQDWTTLPNGVPSMFIIDQQNDYLVLVPGVDSGNSGAVVLLDYISVPTALTSDSSQLLNGDTILNYYAMAVVNWAAAEVLTYAPLDAAKLQKRALLLKDYERYTSQAIMIYNNMMDEPLQMRGGRFWQDQQLYGVPNAFT